MRNIYKTKEEENLQVILRTQHAFFYVQGRFRTRYLGLLPVVLESNTLSIAPRLRPNFCRIKEQICV